MTITFCSHILKLHIVMRAGIHFTIKHLYFLLLLASYGPENFVVICETFLCLFELTLASNWKKILSLLLFWAKIYIESFSMIAHSHPMSFGVYNTDRQCNKTVKIEQLHDQRQWSKNIEYKTLLVLNNIGKTTIQTLTW
jgi:hypothetical protein